MHMATQKTLKLRLIYEGKRQLEDKISPQLCLTWRIFLSPFLILLKSIQKLAPTVMKRLVEYLVVV